MGMPRLSISLEGDQEEWITERKAEMGVSKGKIVRECIEAVRTGDSLFTTTVNTGEKGDERRLQEVEDRLESLEQLIRNQDKPTEKGGELDESPNRTETRNEGDGVTASPESSQPTPPTSAEDNQETDTSASADSTADSPASSPSPSLPSSLLNDTSESFEDPASSTATDATDSDMSPTDSSSISDVTTSNESPTQPAPTGETRSSDRDRDADVALRDGDQDPPEGEPSRERPPGSRAGSNTGTTDSSKDERDDGAGSTETGSTERPARTAQPGPDSRDAADEDEIQKMDVDKSDPAAVRARLQSELDPEDLATAVFACWKQLRDRGTVHTRSMQSLFEDYPLGHDDARAWWRDSIEPELVRVPGVRPPEGSGKLYRFKY